MLREGYTHDEIGRRLGCHPKTVQRLLQRLKGRD
jgi:DNA-binding CsgD family transcriptional regulator